MFHEVPGVSTSLVTFCLKLDLNWFVFSKFKSNKPCGCPQLADRSELTAFALCVYENFANKLSEEAKSNVTCLRHAYLDGKFTILMSAKGGTGGVKKALTLAKSMASCPSLYKLYCTKMELLGGKGSRAEFNWCCKQFLDALAKAELNVFGKVGAVNKSAVKDKLSELHNKAKDAKRPDGAKAPEKRERSGTNFPYYKTQNTNGAVLYDYLLSHSLPVSIGDDHVSINVERSDKQLSALEDTLRKSVDKYASKMAKHSAATYTYKLVMMCALSPCHKVDPKDIKSKVASALKK